MNDNQPVLTQELAAGRHRLGVATLNAPRKLNALSLEMLQALDAQLASWARDPAIVAVVLCGAGDKAFCAGGDIRQVAEAIRGHGDGDATLAERYFPVEYGLDYRIHTYPKPLLVWGEGIVMGGGLGLMAGASHRVVTPRSLLAMPEITIGLFPDVGASWFLNRMPEGLGRYLGLTGARVNASDALFLNLADQILAEGSLNTVLDAMAATNWSGEPAQDADCLTDLLTAQTASEAPQGQVQPRLTAIRRMMRYRDVPRMVATVQAESTGDPWLEENAARLVKGSPTSIYVINEQLRRGRNHSLAEAFRMELDMVVQITRRHDFPEGVRALLLDKDNQPQWQPASLEAVEPQWVAAHFESPWPAGEGPLANLGRSED